VKIKGPPTSDNEKKEWEVEEATYIVPCIKNPSKLSNVIFRANPKIGL
jgi:hypothetical protein